MQFNYKTAFIFLFILLSGFSSYAQMWDLSPRSELEQKLKNAPSDKQKIYLLNSIIGSELFRTNDSLEVIAAQEGIAMVKSRRSHKVLIRTSDNL